MIRSFKCDNTEALSKGHPVKQFINIAKVARRKLRQLEIANRLDNWRVPPDNHLEALKGNRSGQHSIRINIQWQLCFRWTDYGAEEVEIVDYH
jgi:toxin HigB-1